MVRHESYSGPLPHPQHFNEYEAALPGSADRILSMAEQNLAHRTMVEAKAQNAEIADQRRGMYLGAGIFALLIACAFATLSLTGSVGGAALFLGAGAIGSIANFIRGRNGK